MKKNHYLLFLLICWFVGCSAPQLTQTNITTNISLMPIISSTPDPTIIPSPTYDYWCWEKEKECELAKNLGVNIQQIDSFSPNMQWAVIYDTKLAKMPPDKDIGGFRFVKVDGSQEWRFNATQMSQDIGECSNIFMTNAWSPDSRYVYFSPNPSYCSRMFNYSDVGTQVLYRLDVRTGAVEEYLPFVKYRFSSGYERWGLYTFEFSPDGHRLIYFQSYGSPMIIKVRDLTTEDEVTYELDSKYLEAGCPAWMDDNSHIVFYAATTTRPYDSTMSSLYIINLGDQTIETVYRDQPNVYCPISNPYYREDNPDATNLIPVMVFDIGYQQGLDQFYLNPITGQKVLWATSTPYPSSTPKP